MALWCTTNNDLLKKYGLRYICFYARAEKNISPLLRRFLTFLYYVLRLLVLAIVLTV